jgi:hypothetical protein
MRDDPQCVSGHAEQPRHVDPADPVLAGKAECVDLRADLDRIDERVIALPEDLGGPA